MRGTCLPSSLSSAAFYFAHCHGTEIYWDVFHSNIHAYTHTDTFPCWEIKSASSLYLLKSKFGDANVESCSTCKKNSIVMSGQMSVTSADVAHFTITYIACSAMLRAEVPKNYSSPPVAVLHRAVIAKDFFIRL